MPYDANGHFYGDQPTGVGTIDGLPNPFEAAGQGTGTSPYTNPYTGNSVTSSPGGGGGGGAPATAGSVGGTTQYDFVLGNDGQYYYKNPTTGSWVGTGHNLGDEAGAAQAAATALGQPLGLMENFIQSAQYNSQNLIRNTNQGNTNSILGQNPDGTFAVRLSDGSVNTAMPESQASALQGVSASDIQQAKVTAAYQLQRGNAATFDNTPQPSLGGLSPAQYQNYLTVQGLPTQYLKTVYDAAQQPFENSQQAIQNQNTAAQNLYNQKNLAFETANQGTFQQDQLGSAQVGIGNNSYLLGAARTFGPNSGGGDNGTPVSGLPTPNPVPPTRPQGPVVQGTPTPLPQVQAIPTSAIPTPLPVSRGGPVVAGTPSPMPMVAQQAGVVQPTPSPLPQATSQVATSGTPSPVPQRTVLPNNYSGGAAMDNSGATNPLTPATSATPGMAPTPSAGYGFSGAQTGDYAGGISDVRQATSANPGMAASPPVGGVSGGGAAGMLASHQAQASSSFTPQATQGTYNSTPVGTGATSGMTQQQYIQDTQAKQNQLDNQQSTWNLNSADYTNGQSRQAYTQGTDDLKNQYDRTQSTYNLGIQNTQNANNTYQQNLQKSQSAINSSSRGTSGLGFSGIQGPKLSGWG